MDAILALRLLAKLHRNFNRQLHVAYIDSVDRVALWKKEIVGYSIGLTIKKPSITESILEMMDQRRQ